MFLEVHILVIFVCNYINLCYGAQHIKYLCLTVNWRSVAVFSEVGLSCFIQVKLLSLSLTAIYLPIQ